MSLNIGFDSGLKSLLSAQAALQTIGNNIANANTPGYAREQVLLSESFPVSIGGFSFGTGVDIATIRRVVDEGLEQRLLLHGAVLSRLSVERSGLGQIESIVGGAGGLGLSTILGNLFGSFTSLAGHADDDVFRGDVLSKGGDLAAALRQIAGQLSGVSQDSRANAQIRVAQVNSIASQIAQLNAQIGNLKGLGQDAHALADQRQQLLTQLADSVEATTINDPNGMVRVLVGGHTLVGGPNSYQLQLFDHADGTPGLRVKGGIGEISLGNGSVAGLLKLAGSAVPAASSQMDAFAKSLILAFNRVHSTGVPKSGGFTMIQALNAPSQGSAGVNTALKDAGFPFDVQSGELYVTVRNTATGAIEKTKLPIDPNQSLQSLANSLNGISHLSASIDGEGHLRIAAQTGYQFDFSPQLDTNPDGAGAFGGGAGAITSTLSGPFALTAGATLQIAVDGGAPQTITFTAGQFANIGAATAAEVAAAINSQLSGATATVQNGAISIVSNTTGAASSIQLTDGAGAPNAVLGFSTALDSGAATSAGVQISGTYTGSKNETWTFKPDADGTVGVTPGLTVGVFDSQGNRIATLDVGQGYSPGTAIDVKDGVKVSFGPAALSASANDQFSLDVVSDSDTSDVLVALGINSFYTGDSASTIAVRSDLAADASLLSAALASSPADGANANRFLALQTAAQSELDGASLPTFLTNYISNLGLDVKRAEDLESSEGTLVADLSRQREEVSGVSMEEEMANLVRFQQAFDAAGRYLRVLQDTTSSLLELIG